MSRKNAGKGQQSAQQSVKRYRYQYIPIILIGCLLFVLPLLIHLHAYKIDEGLSAYFPGQGGVSYDLANWCKSVVFGALAFLMVIYFIGERVFPDQKIRSPLLAKREFRVYIVLSAVFVFFVLISLVFSSRQAVAMGGAPNSYQGSWILIAYAAVFLLSINYFSDDHAVSALLKLLPFAFLLFNLYGVFEFLYKNLYEIPAMQYLIFPSGLWDMVGKVAFSVYHGNISLTFSNPNYAAEYMVLFIPLSLVLIKKSHGAWKALNTLNTAGLLLLLFLTGSVAAICALEAELLVLLIVFRKKLLRVFHEVIPVLAPLLLLAVIIVAAKGMPFMQRYISGNFSGSTVQSKPIYQVEDISLQDNQATFQAKNSEFILEVNGNKAEFLNRDHRAIGYSQKNGRFTFSGFYSPITVSQDGQKYSVDLGYDQPVQLVFFQNRLYALGVNGTPLTDISDRSGFGFDNMQTFATGRGYIWRKSLPLLPQTLFFGFGADCTAFHIPQNDFAGKLNYQGSPTIVIDKPHDLYLQTALNCGLPALVAILGILAVYFISTAKIIHRHQQSAHDANYLCIAAIFAGVIGFSLCSVFYDSSISTMPLFCIMLGMGVALLRKSGKNIIRVRPDNRFSKYKKEDGNL